MITIQAKLFKIYKKQYKIEIFKTIRKDYLGKGKVLQKDFYFIQYLDMEDEILFFLKNPSLEMKQEQAEALCKVLRDDQNCKSVEDVVKQTETAKKRLFNTIKNISKKSNIPIPEKSKEVVLVSKVIKTTNSAYVTLKVQLLRIS
ncbi:hypothetical protein RFI_32263 [Reticulomyxa filosa]|uniref:Uncharacterized protein n=1 Tax=Reticulomyxa filosa TaxID=46433 RepID=X6LT72_RETFI|nr:hypothetical protein RFI_32263 [Reticulomyxa filosa]|eukprot:ETO05133.1 hypothetical protein RFI_32263 [Reticulomyxa filosa]